MLADAGSTTDIINGDDSICEARQIETACVGLATLKSVRRLSGHNDVSCCFKAQ